MKRKEACEGAERRFQALAGLACAKPFSFRILVHRDSNFRFFMPSVVKDFPCSHVFVYFGNDLLPRL
jgi:hypothetical protein